MSSYFCLVNHPSSLIFMKRLIVLILSSVLFTTILFAQPSTQPGCFINNTIQKRVYITTPTGTVYPDGVNLLDYTTNGSVCIYPNNYAVRTGSSLGSCTVTGQGTGTRWNYIRISCPIDEYISWLIFPIGVFGLYFTRRRTLSSNL